MTLKFWRKYSKRLKVDNHISIIITALNAEKYILNGYWDRIFKFSKVKGFKVSLIVFDNGSSDNTWLTIKKRYPSIDLIGNFENLGYGKGTNIAIQYAFSKYKSKYFVLTNQDSFPTRNYLKKLVYFMESNKNAGFVQPLIYEVKNKNSIYSAGHKYLKEGNCFPLTEKKNEEYSEIISGSLIFSIFRSEALFNSGLFDESFFIYYESSDICFRISKAKYKNYCLNSVKVFHDRDIKDQSPFRWYYIHRNKILFWKKHSIKKYCMIKRQYLNRIKNLSLEYPTFSKDPKLFAEYVALIEGLRLSNLKDFYKVSFLLSFPDVHYLIDDTLKKYI